MSSLDSALNSLSASTVHDFIAPRLKNKERLLLGSKLTTVAWGILITGFAFLVGTISGTVIESINMIGSAFYGPVLAAFLVGVCSRKATAPGILSGILAGVGLNLILWLGFPEIHWMWWNCFGCLTAVLVALLFSRVIPSPLPKHIDAYILERSRLFKDERRWLPAHPSLVVYFFLMLSLLLLV